MADSVGGALGRLGVDTVFGVTGSGNFVVTNALIAEGAAFHAARHEGGAICMADGWARVTGRVGVCSVHQGPGLTNTMTGLAEAAKASTPVLVLAGDTPAAARLSNFRIDQHALVESVGAAAERVHSPASAAQDAARALRRAAAERRPVVLMMPIDLSAQPAAEPDGAPAALPPLPAAPRPTETAVADA
ncbi:MAG TPA: thiamine pyrophosphate-binding protein, partial [Solirubrobacteraceae bacterium]|nr:thiamine pyrophosphate-binding protein [Solirubrobacteraceae bacterium]